jgi:hypothetical protein
VAEDGEHHGGLRCRDDRDVVGILADLGPDEWVSTIKDDDNMKCVFGYVSR